MSEYIKRKALINELKNLGWDDTSIIDIVEEFPSADVAPVRHGRWEVEVGMNFFRERNCPVCKKRIESNFWNYCPNCGTKMDGE